MSITAAHLTREDMRTVAWAHFIDDVSARLGVLREENDSFSDEITTAKRRGRIAELKGWLDLAKQAQLRDANPQGMAPPRPYYQGD